MGDTCGDYLCPVPNSKVSINTSTWTTTNVELVCTPCDVTKNEYVDRVSSEDSGLEYDQSKCIQCLGTIEVLENGKFGCKEEDCAEGYAYDPTTNKCEFCEGGILEKKCTTCGSAADSNDRYWDTTEKKCKVCIQGTIPDPKSCVPC